MHWASNAAQLNLNRQVFPLHSITAQGHPPRNALPGSVRVCLDSYSARPTFLQPSGGNESAFMTWYFIFFFISGFCSVLYELVWLRLSMAQFGVTTAMVSIVLSVFMAGLGLGSWASGAWTRRYGERFGFPALRLYAAIELLIGASGILVPYELRLGRNLLGQLGSTSSGEYYVVSGIWVALTLIPWCALMGATIPVAMMAIERMFPKESSRSFSYLYTANVAGAVAGTTLPLFLIEMLGFHGTLTVGAACNATIAILALTVSRSELLRSRTAAGEAPKAVSERAPTATGHISLLALLFTTGLTSMGMEVVWVRQFTPYLGTVVYAFASILAVYLSATFMGSRVYRRWSLRGDQESPLLWTLLALFALFPLVAASPILVFSGSEQLVPRFTRLVLGIAPFTGLLGFLTPMLVDRWAGGNPAKAGKAYAVNVLGCILGPLAAGFVLLPWISERWALVLLSLPWLVLGLRPARQSGATAAFRQRAAAYLLLPLAVGLFLASSSFEKQYGKNSEVLRDSTATVTAAGTGMKKHLLVNGYGMTSLTPITKTMAHLPLAFLDRPPQDALVICFGMGTTFRSLRSWGIPVTAVELVPSVPRLFGYFHSDGPEILSSPLSHVVIDDGRRYLERTSQQYDVITIDPPPPVEAAGSSLLYSEDFYSVVKQRLRPGGILQQWIPYGDAEDLAAVAQALRRSFPFIRVFTSAEGWGYHFLASDRALPTRTAEELAQRLPGRAAADFVEWGPEPTAEDQFDNLLGNEMPIDQLISASPATPALSDDRPINEYYVLRRKLYGSTPSAAVSSKEPSRSESRDKPVAGGSL
jgi:predicted membrane-bound spermidine synthase